MIAITDGTVRCRRLAQAGSLHALRHTLAYVTISPLTLSLAACLAMPTWASTQCREQFAAGVAPAITNLKLKPRTQEVCFESYAVLNSGISRTPLYSAEHLTRANLE